MGKENRGITFIEVAIAVAILGVVYAASTAGIRILNSLHKQASLVQMEQDAQELLYNIVTEIRNARTIDEITPSKLKMTVYNLKQGKDVAQNNNLFNPASYGTITYEYKTVGGHSYLVRDTVFGVKADSKKFFKDQLLTPSVPNYIFRSPTASVCPCDSTEVVIRMNPGYFKNTPKIYQSLANIRSFIGS